MKSYKNKLIQILIYCALSPALACPIVHAIKDAEIVQGLETLGEWEAAYPLACQLAEKQDNYQAWRDIAKKYAEFDANNTAYLQAWQQVQLIDSQKAYQEDFFTLKPDSAFNVNAALSSQCATREII